MKANKELSAIEKRVALEAHGYVVGNRDYRLNTDYPGDFMVAEAYTDEETPTTDGSNGPWCIVGFDLNALIAEAYDCATPFDASSEDA